MAPTCWCLGRETPTTTTKALAVWAQRSHLDWRSPLSLSAQLPPDDGELVIEPGVARRVPAMMTDDEPLSRRLCELLLDEASGGLGGSAYICGQSAFAQGVIQALTACLTQHFERQGLETNQATDRARAAYYRMSGAGRFMLDVFTPFKPEMAAGVLGDTAYDASEVALHNDPAHGFWMVIRGQVYDLTEFKEVHPGGAKILTASAGMDGTRAYEKVEHHLNSEVHAMLDMYKIGRVRRLRLGTRWDYALMPDQMAVFRTDEVFKLWVNRLYAIVELQNAWANDVSVHALALTEGEQPYETTPLKTVLFLESIRRLATRTVDDLCGSDLLELWCATAGIWAQEVPLRRHQEAVDALLEGDARAQALRALDAWGTELRARAAMCCARRRPPRRAALRSPMAAMRSLLSSSSTLARPFRSLSAMKKPPLITVMRSSSASLARRLRASSGSTSSSHRHWINHPIIPLHRRIAMRVADLMNRRAAAIVPSATMQRAAELLVLTQASDLCVVDHDNRFLGIVSEGDLIRAAMPDFDEVIAYGASNAQTLEILLETGRSIASEPVERLIIKSPLTLAPDDSLMRAAAVMLDKMIRRLPVVEHERLLGTLSRADLVWGMMCLNTNQRS